MANEKKMEFVVPDDYQKILRCYVTSPLHLKRTMEIILPVTPTSIINHIYRSYLWLLFSGMTTEMSVQVKSYDVDFRNMRIRVSRDMEGRVSQPIYRSKIPRQEWYYPIYAESVEDLMVACELREFDDPPRGPGRKERHCIRADGTEILRTYREGEKQTIEKRLHNSLNPAIQNAMKRVRTRAAVSGEPLPEWFPEELTCKRVETSGKFYRAFMEERMGALEWIDPHILSTYLAWRYRPDDQ